jgi:hypothetical protein
MNYTTLYLTYKFYLIQGCILECFCLDWTELNEIETFKISKTDCTTLQSEYNAATMYYDAHL